MTPAKLPLSARIAGFAVLVAFSAWQLRSIKKQHDKALAEQQQLQSAEDAEKEKAKQAERFSAEVKESVGRWRATMNEIGKIYPTPDNVAALNGRVQRVIKEAAAFQKRTKLPGDQKLVSDLLRETRPRAAALETGVSVGQLGRTLKKAAAATEAALEAHRLEEARAHAKEMDVALQSLSHMSQATQRQFLPPDVDLDAARRTVRALLPAKK